MLPYEDIHFQLLDLPPVSSDFMEPWLPNTLQTADHRVADGDIVELHSG